MRRKKINSLNTFFFEDQTQLIKNKLISQSFICKFTVLSKFLFGPGAKKALSSQHINKLMSPSTNSSQMNGSQNSNSKTNSTQNTPRCCEERRRKKKIGCCSQSQFCPFRNQISLNFSKQTNKLFFSLTAME